MLGGCALATSPDCRVFRFPSCGNRAMPRPGSKRDRPKNFRTGRVTSTILESLRRPTGDHVVKALYISPLLIAVLTAAGPYPKMAPLSQYLMDRQAEIDLARSAAPTAISGHATILVLTPRRYETAVEGTNGSTCLVERSWTKAFDDDN